MEYELDDSLVQLASMGRASGIHLILSCQRPDAKVFEGLVKANFSSTAAFAVKNRVNSNIILDRSGAELIRQVGEMIYQTSMLDDRNVRLPAPCAESMAYLPQYLYKQGRVFKKNSGDNFINL